MRFLKVFFGLAVVVTVMTGCGGGSAPTTSTSSSASSTGSTSSSSASSSTTSSSTTSSSSTGSSSTGSGSSGGGSSTGSGSSSTNNGTATLSWTAPTTNSDGSALTDLAGYRIHYGTSAGSLDNEITVASASEVSYQVTNLAVGTWYFAVTSYTTSGLESSQSSVVSKTIS